MLRFVEIGVGMAVVNGFCAAPPGVTLRPVEELPRLHYRLLRRRLDYHIAAQDALADDLRHATARWRDR
jgi:hypothetical protein